MKQKKLASDLWMEKNRRSTDRLLIPQIQFIKQNNPIHKANPIHPNPIHEDQKTFQPPQAKLQKNKSEENHEILKAGVFMGAAISAFAVYRIILI